MTININFLSCSCVVDDYDRINCVADVMFNKRHPGSNIMDYVTSESRSPKKRFSLRLASFLINGTVKILREQVILLEIETVKQLQVPKLRRPILQDTVRSEDEDSPFTPVIAVKTKRKGKKNVVVETPTEQVPPVVDVESQNLESVTLQPNSDLITLRETYIQRPLATEDVIFGDPDFLPVPEDMDTLLLIPQQQRPPESAMSSSPGGTPQVIQVEAQVYFDKEGTKQPASEIRPLPEEVSQPMEIAPIEIPLAEIEIPVASAAVAETPLGAAVIEAPTASAAVAEAPPAVAEAPSASGIVTETPSAPTDVDTPVVVTSAKRKGPAKKKPLKNQAFLSTQRRTRVVRINRCTPTEGLFINKYCPLPDPVYNPCEELDLLMEQLPHNEMIDELLDKLFERPVLRKGSSMIREAGHSDDEHGRSSGALVRPRQSSIEPQPVISGQQLSTSPKKKLRHTTIDRPALSSSISVPHEVSVQVPPVQSTPIIDDQLLPVEEPVEELIPHVEKILSPLPAEKRKRPREIDDQATPVASRVEELMPRALLSPNPFHYKQRQQNIINIIANWNFKRGDLTIDDVAEKPIVKKTIAQAFSDLLVLAASALIVLVQEKDSIDLKCIKKGSKFL